MQSRKIYTFQILVLVFLSSMVISCQYDVKTYALISHTRLNDNSGVNDAVSQLDLTRFDVVMLGGDMANLSAHDDIILSYLDSIFDVSNSKTLWALGNHDYTNVDLLKQYTQKKTFYSHAQDNTLFLVLDTQLDSSRITGNQLQFFESITDTLTGYDNVIVLTHKLIWMRDHNTLDNQIDSVSNGHYGSCSYCIQSNNFYSDVYPALLELKAKNINVFCVAGDVGFKVSNFEYVTNDGIVFLASGMDSESKHNAYIEFTNNLESKEITYSFCELTTK